MPNDVLANDPDRPDTVDQRLLAHMTRGPQRHYSAVQLARNTGIPLPEVQRHLAKLERAGTVVRSKVTQYPAFQLRDDQLRDDQAPG
jgi:Fic family protein